MTHLEAVLWFLGGMVYGGCIFWWGVRTERRRASRPHQITLSVGKGWSLQRVSDGKWWTGQEWNKGMWK